MPVVVVEIKNNKRVMPADFSGINAFIESSGKKGQIHGVVYMPVPSGGLWEIIVMHCCLDGCFLR